MSIPTPYYLIDEAALSRNLAVVERLRAASGAKFLLALKCFATWAVFPLLARHLDGTTSSSLYEVKLGREKFGGETHAYSVAFADHEIDEVVANADKVIFNSLGQLQRFANRTGDRPFGLRLNPGVSHSAFDLADPARRFSRLGESDPARTAEAMDLGISGVMIHANCENDSYDSFERILGVIEERFGDVFARLEWVSLGGGIHFTAPDYPVERLGALIRRFAERYGVQVYLEPGEAVVTKTTTLEVTVLDVLDNERRLAVVDSSAEAHMLDLIIYRQQARIDAGDTSDNGAFDYLVCGKSCLAGDVFGELRCHGPLEVGARLSILDAAGYTMVKKNWFNGVSMPALAVRRASGQVEVVRGFSFGDYVASLS